MYNRTMSYDPEDILNITVTAQYFQMNEIVDFCEEQMGKMIKSSIYTFSPTDTSYGKLKKMLFSGC